MWQPGAACTINVTFKPAAGGSRSATLTLSDNAPESPQSVSLSGAGEDFLLTAVGSSTATVTARQPATYQVQVNSQGGFSGNVSLDCSGALPASTCNVMLGDIRAGGGVLMGATITVATTARSSIPPRRFTLPPSGRWSHAARPLRYNWTHRIIADRSGRARWAPRGNWRA